MKALRHQLCEIGLLFIFSFICVVGFGQTQIKGHVVNAATGTAIPSASVFISNTSKGTSTTSDGYFQLNDVPVGKQELVVSCVGYETNVFIFNSNQLPLSLKIELNVKVKELEGVTVEPFVEGTWAKWGTTFINNFIGITANSLKCRIKNEQAVHFRYFKKSNKLIAYSDEPLLLENKALGYLVTYQLESFELNFKQRTVFFQGYSLFEKLEKDGKEKDKWKANRRQAYEGSIMQFMRSVYENTLVANGYEVRRMVKYLDNTKQEITRYGDHLLNADSLVVQSEPGSKEIYFTDYLYITYNRETEEPGYLMTQSSARKPTWQRSFVTLINGNPVVIDRSGNYYDSHDFLTTGYWGWSEKLANTLPLDYQPEDKSKK